MATAEAGRYVGEPLDEGELSLIETLGVAHPDPNLRCHVPRPVLLRMVAEIRTLRKRGDLAAALVRNVGQQGTCRGCGAPVFCIPHRNGKKAPYTAAGLNHFANCEKAEHFRANKE